MDILTFDTWLTENSRSLRNLSDLDTNRRYKGTRYEYELFPQFRRLQAQVDQLKKKPTVEEWFAMMQNSDAQFYTMVQTGALGQPDVRELWQDLTHQRSATMRKYNLSEGNEEP
jgi:hypothetical protein